MARIKTYGYDRRSKVPTLPGRITKLCKHCETFFAARGKERTCDGCVSEPERLRRQARDHYAALEDKTAQRGSESRTEGFRQTHTTTPKRRNSPRAPQVRDGAEVWSDQGALCRELAHELAVIIDVGKPKNASQADTLKPITRTMAQRITRRNVATGLQDPRDLT